MTMPRFLIKAQSVTSVVFLQGEMLMQKEKIKQRVRELIKRHNTCNPFDLAELCGIQITYAQLQEMNGLYMKYRRVGVIIISTEAPEHMLNYICAHELGHALLHDGLNVHCMTSHGYFSAGKYEREADFFAAELLLARDMQENEDASIYDAAALHGVPMRIAENYAEYAGGSKSWQQ